MKFLPHKERSCYLL